MSVSRALSPQRLLWILPSSSLLWLVVLVLLFAYTHAARAWDRDTDWRVVEIYLATMGYAPDAEGFNYWVGNIQTDSQWTPTTVAQSFFDQPLVQAQYPDSMGYGPLIEALYQNIFGRAADTDGYNYWLAELEAGRVLRNQMVIALINGGWDNPEAATDMSRFGNRVNVALAFARYQSDHGIVYSQLSAEDQVYLRQAGRDVLNGIESSEDDAQIGESRIAELLARLIATYPSDLLITTRQILLDREYETLHAVLPKEFESNLDKINYNLVTELQYRLILRGESFDNTEYLIREYFGLYSYELLSQIPETVFLELNADMFFVSQSMNKSQILLLNDIAEDILQGTEAGYALRAQLHQDPVVTTTSESIMVGDSVSLEWELPGPLNSRYQIQWEQSDAWQVLNPQQSTTLVTYNIPIERYLSVNLSRQGEATPVERSGIELRSYVAQPITAEPATDAPGHTDIGNGLLLPDADAQLLVDNDATYQVTEESSELLRLEISALQPGTTLRYRYNPLYIRDPLTLQFEYNVNEEVFSIIPINVNYEKHEITFQLPLAVPEESFMVTSKEMQTAIGNKVDKNHYVAIKQSNPISSPENISAILDGRRSLFEKIAGNYISDNKGATDLVDFIYRNDGEGKAKLQYVLENNKNGYSLFLDALNMVVAAESMSDLVYNPSWTGESQWQMAVNSYYEYNNTFACDTTSNKNRFHQLACDLRFASINKPVSRLHDGLSAWLGRPGLTTNQKYSVQIFKAIANLAGGLSQLSPEDVSTVGAVRSIMSIDGSVAISQTSAPNSVGYLWGAAFDASKAISAAKTVRQGIQLLPGAILPGLAINYAGNILAEMYESSLVSANVYATAPIVLAVGAQNNKLKNARPYTFEFAEFVEGFFNNEFFMDVYDYLLKNRDGKWFGKHDPQNRLADIFLIYDSKLNMETQRSAQTWFKAAFGAPTEVALFEAATNLSQLVILDALLDAKSVADAKVLDGKIYIVPPQSGKSGGGSLFYTPQTEYKAYVKSQYKEKTLMDKIFRAAVPSAQSQRMPFTSTGIALNSENILGFPNYTSADNLFSRMGFKIENDLFAKIQSGQLKLEGMTIRIGGYPVLTGANGAMNLGEPSTRLYQVGSIGSGRFNMVGGYATLSLASLIPALAETEWDNKLIGFELALKVSQNGKAQLLSDQFMMTTFQDTNKTKPVSSEKGNVLGRVVDSNGIPIAGTLVRLLPIGLTTTTDENGNYEFRDLVKGNYTVEIISDRIDIKPVVDTSTLPDGDIQIIDPTDPTEPTDPNGGFKDNGDGTVTDTRTGLTWMRCSVGQTWTGSTCSGDAAYYSWNEAKSLNMIFSGYSDWRLPSPWELITTADFSRPSSRIDDVIFPNTPSHLMFWSAYPDAYSPYTALHVDFGSELYGHEVAVTGGYYRSDGHLVRLVRGGRAISDQATPTSDFIDNGDGTVTHSLTGLIWMRCSMGQTWTGSECAGGPGNYSWNDAQKLKSAVAGYSDWRLPSIQELVSVVEYANYLPAINLTVFPNTDTCRYWSSSVAAGYSGYAWVVRFDYGQAGIGNRETIDFMCARLVSSGQSADLLTAHQDQMRIFTELLESDNPFRLTINTSTLPLTLLNILDLSGATLGEVVASADGQQFVFATDAALLPDDTNDHRDLYHYGATTDCLTLLSRAPDDGAASNADSGSPRFDVTGNRVLFLSRATNLVPGEQNAAQQLYQVDLDSGLIRRLSETVSGQPANGDISQLELAAEAGKVVFRSEASNLESGPGLYLQDLETGLRELLVSSIGSSPTDPQAERPAIDANASLLAYDRPDRNGQSQIQTLELATRAERQETPLDAATVSACCARISSDGRYLAWRETDIDGRIRLRLLDEATGKDALIDWPATVTPDSEIVRLDFRNGGRELWWIALEQGAEGVEALYKAPNPVFVAPASLH
jgi:hypothetical protein